MPEQNDIETSAVPRGGRFRKELIIIGLFLLFPAVIYFGMRRVGEDISGSYIVAGGQGYLVLERRFAGYEVLHFSFPWSASGGYGPGWKVQTRGGLRLECETAASPPSGPGTVVMHFRASPHHKGDFDLTLMEEIPGSSTWYERILDPIKRWWAGRTPATLPPLPGYLHRIPDARATAYMELAEKEPKPLMPGHAAPPAKGANLFAPSVQVPQLLNLARAAHERHQNDLYLRVLLMDALCRSGDVSELSSRLQEWNMDFASAGPEDTLATAMYKQLQRKARGLAAAQNQRNAYADFLTASSSDTSLPVMLSFIAGMTRHDALSRPDGVTCPSENVMNFLQLQVATKVSGVYIWFKLLHRDIDGALQLALGRFQMGQFISQFDTFVITKLIGIAVRSMSATDLQRLAANAPLTIPQCDAFGAELTRLAADELPAYQVSFRDWELPVEIPSTGAGVNQLEASSRHNAAGARFQLARVLLAARRALIQTGDFPDLATADWEKPVLPTSVPMDPFSSTTSPKALKLLTTSQTLVAYSIGPDSRDDGAKIEYDPTNGTVSPGDISAELRRTPRYPFPAEGVFAETTSSVSAMFPEGLPTDPFADRSRARGLSLVQTTGSVVVMSFGPDVDQQEFDKARGAYVPTLQYDPTNGTVSHGDLITTLARTREELHQ